MTVDDPRIGLLRELADPIRLRVVDRLGHGGPATVSRLAGERPDGMVDLGPAAAPIFAELGVDVAAVRPGRQRFAFECLDATERAPHLAGALADALAASLMGRDWVRREPGGRTIRLTPPGAEGLR